jgi:hypothetical protein
MSRMLQRRGVSLVGLALLGVVACKKPASQTDASPAGSSSPAASSSAKQPFKPAAPVASASPLPVELVSKVVNPKNEPAYSGPTGSVKGVVTASGDQAPDTPAHLAKIKDACPEGRAAYAKLFREGMMRNLADVLVAVTGYTGYVPEKEPKVTVAARGCAFSTRTVATTFGQTIEVVSKDGEAYVPNLLGSRMEAQLLAIPGGAASPLYPPAPGHYFLTDDIKVFMMADVFVVKYPTHDVTSLDGRFEIKDIPVGKVTLSAMLPATRAVVEKEIEIKAGEVLDLALTLPFDAKAFAAATAPSASAASPPPK